MKKYLGWLDVVSYILLTIFSLPILYPMLNLVAISFSSSVPIMQGRVTLWPVGFNLEAYSRIFQSRLIPRAYFNTILYTVVGLLINMTMTAITAYPLSQDRMPGRNIWIRLITLTLFLNAGAIPLLLVVRALKLYNTLWAMSVPNAIWTLELMILVSFYRGIPSNLVESMKLDGARHLTLLFRLYLPLSKASLASIALFYFMGHWNSFFIPLIYLQDRAKYPLQLVLRDMLLEGSETTSALLETANLTPIAVKNATIVVTVIPVLLVYPFAQKYFVEGVMIGSLKG
jgi:putative aldouronate transport system permease protein